MNMLNSDLKKAALNKLKEVSERYASLGKKVNEDAVNLLTERKKASTLIKLIEDYINLLVNTPKDFEKKVKEIKINIDKFSAILEIEYDEKRANKIVGGISGAGVLAGAGVAAFGPTAAMAIATTFGTASTGTAISALSGAAATNAALAWLGGGALTAGGGGMAAGSALLGLAGPLGWAIGGSALIGGAVLANKKNKKIAVKAQQEMIEIEKQIAILQGVRTEISQLIQLTNEHVHGIHKQYYSLSQTAPSDYRLFTDEQKLEIGALVNNTLSLSKLINKQVGK